MRRVMTSQLAEAIPKLLGNCTKEVRWANVPENHTTEDPEVSKKILKFQQLQVLVNQLDIHSAFFVTEEEAGREVD